MFCKTSRLTEGQILIFFFVSGPYRKSNTVGYCPQGKLSYLNSWEYCSAGGLAVFVSRALRDAR